MSKTALGIGPKDHKELKGLPSQAELRDHMTEPEIAIKTLGETAGKTLIVARDTKDYEATREASLDGAKVAGAARAELEKQLGRPVVSKDNYLPPRDPDTPPKIDKPKKPRKRSD